MLECQIRKQGTSTSRSAIITSATALGFVFKDASLLRKPFLFQIYQCGNITNRCFFCLFPSCSPFRMQEPSNKTQFWFLHCQTRLRQFIFEGHNNVLTKYPPEFLVTVRQIYKSRACADSRKASSLHYCFWCSSIPGTIAVHLENFLLFLLAIVKPLLRTVPTEPNAFGFIITDGTLQSLL